MADKKKYSTQLRRVPARPRSERLRRNGLGDVETRRRRERRSDEEIEKLRNRLEWREDISMKTWDRIDSLVVASRYVPTASDAAVKAGDTLYAKVWRETALGVTREAVSYGRVTCLTDDDAATRRDLAWAESRPGETERVTADASSSVTFELWDSSDSSDSSDNPDSDNPDSDNPDNTDSPDSPLCSIRVPVISDGESALTVDVMTDYGNIIRNGEGQRTLTAHVLLGAEEITDTLPAGSFSWFRTSHDPADDVTWNNLHNGTGNVCVVDADDVNRSAMFECKVTLPQQPPSD